MKNCRLIALAIVCGFAIAAQAQTYNVVANFNTNPSAPYVSGIIAQGRGGYLLSTTPDFDGSSDNGTVFRVSTSGELTALHIFEVSNAAEGASPNSGLTLGKDGRYYGAAGNGGINDVCTCAGYYGGTIFAITPDGTYKKLHDFNGADGSGPIAPPIESLQGNFYGTTSGGSGSVKGTVYRITAQGALTTLHTFTGADGAAPYAPLLQTADYWFYGTTTSGGTSNFGTIFRINASGNFQVLHNFTGADGQDPISGVIQANDGNFYGVTTAGGAYNSGVVFKMTPTHQVTVLHSFTGGADGSEPFGRIVEASDGNLYGTTIFGGANGVGVLFRITTAGVFTVLHDFDTPTGAEPIALMQHTNGLLYGDTYRGGSYGGSYGNGVFYSYDSALPPFVSYLPSYGRVGMTVQILGQGFTTASQAFFNGVPAQVTGVTATYLRAVIPQGATSGFITVTTSSGILKSNKIFVVRP